MSSVGHLIIQKENTHNLQGVLFATNSHGEDVRMTSSVGVSGDILGVTDHAVEGDFQMALWKRLELRTFGTVEERHHSRVFRPCCVLNKSNRSGDVCAFVLQRKVNRMVANNATEVSQVRNVWLEVSHLGLRNV